MKPGLEYELRFRVPESKTVPALYPESAEFREMPRVFATGFLVGLLEWACILAIRPHLDWPREQSVGTHLDVSHCAPTPPGQEITVRARLVELDGRRLVFELEARDGAGLVSKGRHERCLIERPRFDEKVRLRALAPAPCAT